MPLPSALDTDVVVLPREVLKDGRGLYDDSVITLVKEFRLTGVTAGFAHDPDARAWFGEKSFTGEFVDLAIGIASNAGWTALWWLLRRRPPSSTLRVRVARRREVASTVAWECYEVEGRAADVAQALAMIESPNAALTGSLDEKAEKEEG
jgi:hypothetical protein